MPELPEVETVRRGLRPVMEGARFDAVEVRRPDLRWPLPPDLARRLRGQCVGAIRRRAKYLLFEIGSEDVLLLHLGMSGSVRVAFPDGQSTPGRFHHPRSREGAHDHVVFRMSNGAEVTFNDPRRFGAMLLVRQQDIATHPLLTALGPEPLDPAFTAVGMAQACAGRKISLKSALSDQKLVAGLGNIYVCEALHRAGLSPRRSARTIASRAGGPTGRAVALVEAVRAVLEEAIAAGGSSLRDHRRTDGELGAFQHTFRVYDREGRPCPAPGCSGMIRRIVQSGRSSFFCPACQR